MERFIKSFFYFKKQPLSKKFVNAIIIAFVLSSVYFFSGDYFHASTAPFFSGTIAIVSIIFIMTPYFVYNFSTLKKKFNKKYLYFLEFLIALAVFFNGLGSIGLYNAGFEYDSMIHVTDSVLVVLVFFSLFAAINEKLFHDYKKTMFVGFALIIFLGIAFEFYEYYGDILFGTSMSGQIGQPLDTQIDVVCDIFGGLAGAYILSIKHDELIKIWKK